MINDIEAGKINLVICKDLSRLGRNYLETGAYIEIFFPEKGVRFLALNDSVDTINIENMDFVPFRNILNSMYSKDISKKIKSAIRSRFLQGKFMGVSAPYGFLKDPNDKNHLVIDPETAPIVRRIYEWAKLGLGIAKIRKILTDEKIPRPAAVVFPKGGNYERYFEGREDQMLVWSNNSVRGILRNPVYAGHLAGYKRPLPSMKSKKRLSTLPENWEIVRNTHEAIIPDEEWELVQRLITSRRKGEAGASGYDNIFSNLIKCADCGYALTARSDRRRKRERPIQNTMYSCTKYCTYGTTVCTQHRIEAVDLHRIVLEDIQKHANIAITNDKKLLERIVGKMDEGKKSEMSAVKKELRQAEKRITKLDKLFSMLYEDRVNEKINERNYLAMSGRYEEEQNKLDARISQIKKQLTNNQSKTDNAHEWVARVKAYGEITELSAPLLNALIDRITVTEAIVVDGVRQQTVNIYYKFVGCIS